MTDKAFKLWMCSIVLAAGAIILGGVLYARSGPDPVLETYKVDQCMRREIFQQCMSALPAGPQKVDNSNDWDEVVVACDGVAYRQAVRIEAEIKKECQA